MDTLASPKNVAKTQTATAVDEMIASIAPAPAKDSTLLVSTAEPSVEALLQAVETFNDVIPTSAGTIAVSAETVIISGDNLEIQTEENTVLEEVAVPPAPATPVFTHARTAKGLGRYFIDSNALRKLLVWDLEDSPISASCIDQDDDTEATKQIRRSHSAVSVTSIFKVREELNKIDDEFLKDSDSGLSFNDFVLFRTDIEDRFKTYAQAALDAFSDGNIKFEQLQIVLELKIGQNIVLSLNGAPVYGKLRFSRLQKSMMGPYLENGLELYASNGDHVTSRTETVYIMGYEGVEPLTELGIEQFTLDSDRYKEFVARGHKYLSLVKAPAYIQVSGAIARQEGRRRILRNADGRGMVDLTGMRSIDPSYANYIGLDPYRDSDDRFGSGLDLKDLSKISDEIKASCIPFLYGFSFKAKMWGQLNIDQISDIKFRSDAYEKLVLDNDTKEMIFSLVEDKASTEGTDLIDGKGGGCIFLLAGDPGVGKTLTAESVAERLKRPLHSVSVGELGTSVEDLESNLRNILEVASTWGAIVLIDEADIFLSARNNTDIVRNSMVAVFLRLLEYFPGILFLTSNLAENLDAAFESRITMTIHYSKLTFAARTSIWQTLLRNADIKNIDIRNAATTEMNGRQIKQAIKVAGAWARFKGRNVTDLDFAKVLEYRTKFKASMKPKAMDTQMSAALSEIKEVPKADPFETWPTDNQLPLTRWQKIKNGLAEIFG